MILRPLAVALLATLALPCAGWAQPGPPRAAKVLDVPPSDALPALKQVEALEAQGKLAEAQKALDQIRMANPTRIEPLIFIGQRLYERAPAEAQPWFQQVLTVDPDNAYAHAFLARIDAQAGQIDAARVRLNAADRKRPDSLELHLARADVEMKRNQPSLALSALDNAKNLARPGMETAQLYYRIADADFALGKWADAEQALTWVLAAVPHPARQLQRGDARANQGKYPEAIEDYEAAGKSEMGKDPKFAAAVAQRIDTVKKAANRPFEIDRTRITDYYILVTQEEDRAAKPTFTCSAGAYVFAIAEIAKQLIGDMSEAPIRKVGSPGTVGKVVLAPDLLDPWKLTVVFVTMDKPEDIEAAKERKRMRFCR